MYGATPCKIAASMDKNCGNESKNRTLSKYLIFSMYIFQKLTFRNLTDFKKSINKNELLHNVTYNYQKSKCHWNFATLHNFHRPFLTYEIRNNFLTSPNEHTVERFIIAKSWNFYQYLFLKQSILFLPNHFNLSCPTVFIYVSVLTNKWWKPIHLIILIPHLLTTSELKICTHLELKTRSVDLLLW